MSIKSIISQNRNNEIRGVNAVVSKVKNADLTAAGVTAVDVISLPAGCYITRLYINVTQAFDAGTIDIGTSKSTDKFGNNLGLASTGVTLGTGLGVKFDKITRIRVTPSSITGTDGEIEIVAEFIDSEYFVGTYVEDGK